MYYLFINILFVIECYYFVSKTNTACSLLNSVFFVFLILYLNILFIIELFNFFLIFFFIKLNLFYLFFKRLPFRAPQDPQTPI